MSIQAIEESDWGDSVARTALRRTAILLVIVSVVAGPFLLGGAVGWVMTREAAVPVLGEDGWLRSRPGLAGDGTGFPLVSASELEAAGLTVDEARKILRR